EGKTHASAKVTSLKKVSLKEEVSKLQQASIKFNLVLTFIIYNKEGSNDGVLKGPLSCKNKFLIKHKNGGDLHVSSRSYCRSLFNNWHYTRHWDCGCHDVQPLRSVSRKSRKCTSANRSSN